MGPDAADLVLLANARPEFVERRAGRMVVGSGDHIFVDCALAARARGVRVEVVARHGAAHHTWWRHGFPIVELRDAPARAA